VILFDASLLFHAHVLSFSEHERSADGDFAQFSDVRSENPLAG
jgi:hypothetical protein